MVAINKIIEEKVKARLCRVLPQPLLNYLKTIVKIPKPHGHGGGDASSAENLPLPQIKTRQVEQGPDAEQTDFLFYKEDIETPEMKKRQVKYKIKIINSLLDQYERMSGQCKIKMRFVRDYLEKNLLVLQAIYAKCDKEDFAKKHGTRINKKHTTHPKGHKSDHGDNSQEPIDEQLQTIGWEKRKNKLLDDSDIDKIVRQTMGKGSHNKRETHSESMEKRAGSKQYRALVDAVERVRNKQEKEEKLAKLFGQKRSVRNENYETIRSSNKEAQDLGRINFEEPMVFSVDS